MTSTMPQLIFFIWNLYLSAAVNSSQCNRMYFNTLTKLTNIQTIIPIQTCTPKNTQTKNKQKWSCVRPELTVNPANVPNHFPCQHRRGIFTVNTATDLFPWKDTDPFEVFAAPAALSHAACTARWQTCTSGQPTHCFNAADKFQLNTFARPTYFKSFHDAQLCL